MSDFNIDDKVDITDVVCPTTFVKAKVALEELDDGQILSIRLNDGEPVQNVPRSIKEEGHKILKLLDNEDGTYEQVLNGRKSSGTWTVKDSKLQLSILTVKALSITTQVDGKNMMFVTDATKLLNLFKSIGAKSSNSNIKTVTSLLKSVKGMQAGVTLQKQKQSKGK